MNRNCYIIGIYIALTISIVLAEEHVTYYDIRLPDYPPRGVAEAPGGINESLQICGPNFGMDLVNAYIWQDGTKQDVPFQEGPFGKAHVHAINNHGFTVGGSIGSAQFWNGSTLTSLGTLGGESSIAYTINDQNQIVGRSSTGNGNESRPFLWENGQIVDLGTLGGDYGEAFDINESGIPIGYSKTAEGNKHAFVRQDQSMIDLGTLGGEESMAFSINREGMIVGWAEIENGYQHACLWHNDQIHDLGTLGGNQSQAFAVNDDDLILGWAETKTGYRPLVLWYDGRILRLQELIERNSGWELMIPYGQDIFPWFHLTNNGAILGCGYINGAQQPFLMVPTDKPFLLSDTNGDHSVDMNDFLTFAGEWLK
ncbi:MAG: hypothetical protein JXA82_12455 [Sedimentisphaerales bacterium]|nr:hypothetical protein [Sedimentisphaerales bacterium]